MRAENDHGVIRVRGKEVEVEFWNPFKAIGKAVKSVGSAIGKAARSVGGAVASVARSVGGAVATVARGVGGAVAAAARSVWNGVESLARGVAGGAISFFGGVAGAVGGFFGNVFQGRIGDALDSLVGGLERAFLDAPSRILHGLLAGAENLLDGATRLFGPLGEPMRAVTARIFDAGRSVVTGLHDAARGVVRNVIEGVGTVAGGVVKIFTGDFSGGFEDLGMGLVKTFLQTPADAILLAGGKAVSAVQALLGIEPPGRKLRDDEIAALRSVYGDSIDYSAIRIKEGSAGLFSLNERPFTHGDTIYLKGHAATPELLVHEVAHVWQHQNGGTDYMSEALWAQKFADAYDWRKGLDAGKSWRELDPEQQAELLEDGFASGYFANPAAGFVAGGVDYTAQLEAAWRDVRAGRGAP